MNPNIAPPIELSVDERILEIEKFLEGQEAEAGITPTKPIPKQLAQVPFEGTYKSRTGLFKGETSGQVDLPITSVANGEMVELLKKLVENQEIDRIRYERDNPISGDDPIYDWSEATIQPGQVVQFIYTVPEGHIFYLEYINIVHNVDTTYSIFIDGQYQPTLSYAIEDFGDHMSIWKPSKMCYNNVQVWALNNWVAAQTYATFFRGWNRFYRAINREITYESLEKKKQET